MKRRERVLDAAVGMDIFLALNVLHIEPTVHSHRQRRAPRVATLCAAGTVGLVPCPRTQRQPGGMEQVWNRQPLG